MIAAVLVCLSQYYLHNLIYRGALGEVQAYIFMPLVLWGLYDLFAKGYKKPWIMGIGLVGLMNTHIISLFITAITVFVFCLFHCKVFIKNPKLLLRFLLTIGIVLLVTCWFWMPCIEMMRSGAFKYQTPWANPADYALSFVRLIGFSREGIGMPLVCLCLLRLFVPRKPENRDRVKWADCFMITGLVLAFVSTEYFPWDFFNGLFAQIQFPFRVLAIGTIFLAASIGILAGIVFRGKKARAVAFCAMAGISCLFAMNYYTASISKGAFSDVPAEYFTTAGQFEVGMGEWLPADSGLPDSNEFEGQATDVVLLDNGTAIPMQRTGVKILFEYLPSDGVLTCDVPLLYYKGYSAVLTNEKGEKKPLELSDKGSNHVIQIRLPHEEEGRIEVNYTGTPLQQGSLAVSLGTLAALGIYAFIKRRRKENNMMAQDAPAKTVQEKL